MFFLFFFYFAETFCRCWTSSKLGNYGSHLLTFFLGGGRGGGLEDFLHARIFFGQANTQDIFPVKVQRMIIFPNIWEFFCWDALFPGISFFTTVCCTIFFILLVFQRAGNVFSISSEPPVPPSKLKWSVLICLTNSWIFIFHFGQRRRLDSTRLRLDSTQQLDGERTQKNRGQFFTKSCWWKILTPHYTNITLIQKQLDKRFPYLCLLFITINWPSLREATSLFGNEYLTDPYSAVGSPCRACVALKIDFLTNNGKTGLD